MGPPTAVAMSARLDAVHSRIIDQLGRAPNQQSARLGAAIRVLGGSVCSGWQVRTKLAAFSEEDGLYANTSNGGPI
jgi:hypothetical protein